MPSGFADFHNHQFAELGFGGMAFWGGAFGDISQELPWCTAVHGPGGTGDLLGNTLRAIAYGTGVGSILGHSVGGYPQFDGWPRWDSITHQAVFEDWLSRAVEGGLRLMVMLAVNNEFLCGLANKLPNRSCNDMEAVDLQLQAAKDMEAYIDGKNGGPGRGWYRIVRTPAEAEAVIDQGKLAVVLGTEVDYLFNCRTEGDLTESQLNQQLDRYFDLGVRYVFPIHFSNNGFGGTAFQNALIRSTGGGPVSGRNPLGTIGAYEIQTEDAQSLGYAYRTGRRNVQGLTDLGRALIRGLITRGMVIDVDHMSAYAKADTFDICEALGCPVMSGHSGFIDISLGDKRHEGQLTDGEVERIRKLGGMINPIVRQGSLTEIRAAGAGLPLDHVCGASSNSFAQAYLYAINKMGGAPTGLGTDFNGFAGLPGPRFGPDACPGGHGPGGDPPPVVYPFTAAAAGAVMKQSVVGDKTFDINTDGLAHVGMLPDFIADLQAQGITGNLLDPLLNSAGGYVTLWGKAWSKADMSLPAGPSASGDDMQPGEVLLPGQSIVSANGRYTFVYQGDGNLVLYGPGGALWNTGTGGTTAGVCIMQGDGNLVIYRPGSRPVWSSGSAGSPGSRLVVQDDANVVIYRPDGSAAWSTNTGLPAGPSASGDDMQPGEVLLPGQSIVSANGRYTFVYQGDGNLVLYGPGGALWNTGTGGTTAGVCIMQGDGNLVIYRPPGAEVAWSSGSAGSPGSRLVVQDDANVVIYRPDGSAAWSTNTGLPAGPSASGDDMQPGEVLLPGQSIVSANGRYTFVYQGDGNLVLYGPGGALWNTGTGGTTAGVCIMQGDGNLVIYRPGSRPVWSSGSAGSPGSRLVVQDDANVVIYRPDGSAAWSTNTGLPAGPSASGDDMQPGEVLLPGQSIVSANGRYTFVYQGDGNLVLYGPGGALWNTGTGGTTAGVCIMQGDGNLVIYRPPGAEVAWSSGSAGSPGSRLVVQDDANVVIYRPDGSAAWSTNTGLPAGPSASGDDMQPGEVLLPGQSIVSANGRYTFVYQGDGNLVLYGPGGALWNTGTGGTTAGVCIMQGDGNLVIYRPGSRPVWSSGSAGSPGSRLVVQDDANVVIYRPDGSAAWSTNTVQT